MGELFRELCKGPVVVIDDKLGDTADLINKLVEEIKDNNLPVLKYKKIEDAMKILPGLLFSNFIVLDWKGTGIPEGVEAGEEAERLSEEKVIEFLRRIQEICLAPIFIMTNLSVIDVTDKLEAAGIVTDGKKRVFVENKHVLCAQKGTLISKIEDWIKESPHIYLAKCWANEWLLENTKVFWELYNLNPNWPVAFYHSFKVDVEDPILALRDTLFQLIFSRIDVSAVQPSFLIGKTGDEMAKSQPESLKELYKRLVYIDRDIDKDIRPGDIFEKHGSYYLNVRPECDTTKRSGKNPEIYLLKGDVKTPEQVKDTYRPPYGILDRENKITMLFLDGNDIVVFDKRKLSIKKYQEMRPHKICRVASPFITRWRQSFSSYLGRFGVPSYPKEIVDSLFKNRSGSSEAPESVGVRSYSGSRLVNFFASVIRKLKALAALFSGKQNG